MVNHSEYYDIRQAADYCGYDTTYMVDYLCKEGLVEPSTQNGRVRGRGRKRLFTFQDLLLLRLYRKLLDAGVSVKKLKQALRDSEELSRMEVTRRSIKIGQKEVHRFYADSENVYIRAENEQVIQAGTGGQMVFSFMVSLTDIHAELSDRTKRAPFYRRKKNSSEFYRTWHADSKAS
ncbi:MULTISPECIES: MerR family transcriptional regulator [Kordiimonas]|jgi:DNA-binding transcriptional MerR regulator|uniref:MerR family transcriptional regulator n=1 Tax=Kordiimonas TaxID=288021 RepID=UPI00257987E0|nr:MerR family transcriptional regulator [Kordiimonas sp. UBA4487]